MDRYSKQKISKDIAELHRTNNQLNMMDSYRLNHPTTAKCTFFSSSHGTFAKIDHIPGHEAHLHKFKIIGIIQYDQTAVKLNEKSTI